MQNLKEMYKTHFIFQFKYLPKCLTFYSLTQCCQHLFFGISFYGLHLSFNPAPACSYKEKKTQTRFR